MNPFDISVQRFNEFASEYAKHFMNIESYLPSVDIFCSLIKPPKPSILELACGPGNFTRYLKQRFPISKIIAVDLAPKMIEIAKTQVPGVDFRIMDVRNISSIELTFNAILCSFCLPFLSVKDTQKLIADCADKLESGGAIYISTMEGDETMAGFEQTSFTGKSEIYFNYHQQNNLEAILIKNGFVISDIKRQDYKDSAGGILTDMIFVALKT